MFASSLFLGKSGIYDIVGIKVEFKETSPTYLFFSGNLIGAIGEKLLGNHIFKVLTFGYIHTFVHEMGHALAHKIISGGRNSIEISTSNLSGRTLFQVMNLSPIEESLVYLGGPLADVIFSVLQIFAAFALSAYITMSVAIVIAIGAAIWIFGEAFYAVDSLLANNNGDFAHIARNGSGHLLGAITIMVGVVALGILATSRVM